MIRAISEQNFMIQLGCNCMSIKATITPSKERAICMHRYEVIRFSSIIKLRKRNQIRNAPLDSFETRTYLKSPKMHKSLANCLNLSPKRTSGSKALGP